MRTPAVCIALLLVVSPAFAVKYLVSNANDSGVGSLRDAIILANSPLSPGPDVIRFSSLMAGATIYLNSPLPALTERYLTLNADIGRDGTPDFAIAPSLASASTAGVTPSYAGLTVRGRDITVRGLSIHGFDAPLLLWNARRCEVAACYLGVTLLGGRRAPGKASLQILDSSSCTIGRAGLAGWRYRNVIAIGKSYGIWFSTRHAALAPSNNVIVGNYIGLTPDGMGVLNTGQPPRGAGISLGRAGMVGNTIGGAEQGAGNLFGGVGTGISVHEAEGTTIKGNLFGLMADGDSVASLNSTGVSVGSGATKTQIGGAAPGAGNVFAGRANSGVSVADPGTEGTVIAGNYFGTNRDGTQRRRLEYPINLGHYAGRTTIGGSTPAHGNYFTPSHPDHSCYAISIGRVSDRVTIRHNHIGVLRKGGVKALGTGIWALDGHVRILDNEIAGAYTGVYVNSPKSASVQRNLFRQCDWAVWVKEGPCTLGDLGNNQIGDDGGNEFRDDNAVFIGNTSDKTLKAEGNIFPTTVRAQIDARIYDKLECPWAGRVDFDPLYGGVSPTRSRASLALTGAAAVPTGVGAEITFSLSSTAEVHARILNIAGRPIRTLCTAHECAAGTNALIWNAMSDDGLRVPDGAYLVEIAAKAEDGTRAKALTRVHLQR